MGLQQTNTETGYFGYIWIKLLKLNAFIVVLSND